MNIDLPYNFDYRDYQEPQFLASAEGIKRFYKVWHRRAGKDLSDLNFTIMKAMERPGVYWHILPEYSQARKAIWQGMTADGKPYLDCFPKEIIKRKRDQEMNIELVNGSLWQIMGSDRYNSMRGSAPVGVVFSEYAFTHPEAWGVVEPMLLANDGYAVFNTTPYGHNHAKELWDLAVEDPEWFTQMLTIADTKKENGDPIISEEQIDKLRKMGTTEETIQREYYCSWDNSIEGAYYIKQIQQLEDDGMITVVPYDPSKPVYVYMDIGKTDYTSIWFVQVVGREFRFIDYYQASGEDPEDHVKLFKSKRYNYAEIILPHDANQAKYGMRTVASQFRDLMPNERFRVTPVTSSVQADIMAVRTFIPRCVFDKERCEDGLKALRNYTKKWNDTKNCFDDNPFHNWASHGADAYRYAVLDLMKENNLERPQFDRKGIPTFENLLIGAAQNRSERI